MINYLITTFKDGWMLITHWEKCSTFRKCWNIILFYLPTHDYRDRNKNIPGTRKHTVMTLYYDGEAYGDDWIGKNHNMVANAIAEEHGGIDKNIVNET